MLETQDLRQGGDILRSVRQKDPSGSSVENGLEEVSLPLQTI